MTYNAVVDLKYTKSNNEKIHTIWVLTFKLNELKILKP